MSWSDVMRQGNLLKVATVSFDRWIDAIAADVHMGDDMTFYQPTIATHACICNAFDCAAPICIAISRQQTVPGIG